MHRAKYLQRKYALTIPHMGLTLSILYCITVEKKRSFFGLCLYFCWNSGFLQNGTWELIILSRGSRKLCLIFPWIRVDNLPSNSHDCIDILEMCSTYLIIFALSLKTLACKMTQNCKICKKTVFCCLIIYIKIWSKYICCFKMYNLKT